MLEPPRTPGELAPQLGISPKTLRGWLRSAYLRSAHDHYARWELTGEQVQAARQRFGPARDPGAAAAPAGPAAGRGHAGPRRREASDESYVIDLLDELLGEQASREHRFAWLLGDPGRNGTRARLPVDAYYPQHRLVLEYRERQHEQPTPFFDKPDRTTVSGVHRGQQRRAYDERRETEIPRHGLQLLIVRADELACDRRGRLLRRSDEDQAVLRRLLPAEHHLRRPGRAARPLPGRPRPPLAASSRGDTRRPPQHRPRPDARAPVRAASLRTRRRRGPNAARPPRRAPGGPAPLLARRSRRRAGGAELMADSAREEALRRSMLMAEELHRHATQPRIDWLVLDVLGHSLALVARRQAQLAGQAARGDVEHAIDLAEHLYDLVTAAETDWPTIEATALRLGQHAHEVRLLRRAPRQR